MAERVGDRIRARRKALGLTGTELARRVGAGGKEVVSVWENRDTPPDEPYRSRLVRLFGVTEAWLLHGDAALEETQRLQIDEARAEGYRRGVEDLTREIGRLAGRIADEYVASLLVARTGADTAGADLELDEGETPEEMDERFRRERGEPHTRRRPKNRPA